MLSQLAKIPSRLAIGLIQLYRWTLSPYLGRYCRFEPTCSSYAQEAYRTHGFWRGSALTAHRICRCHPLGGHGFDPVPRS
jgi:putative membrane protein insertion efficiency factor